MRVDTRGLSEALLQFETNNSRIKEMAAEIKSLSASLDAFSGMESIKEELSRQSARLEEAQTNYSRMCCRLDTACSYYTKCENRVLDESEGIVMQRKYAAAEFASLGKISEALAQLIS